MARLVARWRRTESDLANRLGRPPGVAEVADWLSLGAAQRAMVAAALASAGLGGVPGGEARPEDPPDGREGPAAAAERADDLAELGRRLDRLDSRQRTILMLRFGLGARPADAPAGGRTVGLHAGVGPPARVSRPGALGLGWESAPA